MASFWIEITKVKNRPDRENGEYSLGNALWSPQKNTLGADIYKNMRETQIDDIVLHLIDNKSIVGISRIASTVDQSFKCILGTEWAKGSNDRPAYLIKLKNFIDFREMGTSIPKESILNESNSQKLINILNSRESPIFYNSELNLREGAYFTKIPLELVKLINETYRNLNGENISYLDEVLKLNESDKGEISLLLQKKQIILYGPPGTGKTFGTKRLAVKITGDD